MKTFDLRTYNNSSTKFMRIDTGRSAGQGQGQGNDVDDYFHCRTVGYVSLRSTFRFMKYSGSIFVTSYASRFSVVSAWTSGSSSSGFGSKLLESTYPGFGFTIEEVDCRGLRTYLRSSF